MPEFLFISGCARSGTTALAKLIGASPHVVMTVERYNPLSRPGEFSLTPAHFELERLRDIEADPKFRHADTIDRMLDGYEGARFVGDKKPTYYTVYPELFAAFPDARIVFIYRDPTAVASSYEGRLLKGNSWGAKADHRRAVRHWNESLENTLAASEAHPGRVLPVDYETIFMTDAPLDPIAEFLGLDDLDLPEGELATTRKKADRLDDRRESLLSEEQAAWVRKKADGRLLAELDARNPWAPERGEEWAEVMRAKGGLRRLRG